MLFFFPRGRINLCINAGARGFVTVDEVFKPLAECVREGLPSELWGAGAASFQDWGPPWNSPCVSWGLVALGLSTPTFLESQGCVLSSRPPTSQPGLVCFPSMTFGIF